MTKMQNIAIQVLKNSFSKAKRPMIVLTKKTFKKGNYKSLILVPNDKIMA
jgi:hypothetical protein